MPVLSFLQLAIVWLSVKLHRALRTDEVACLAGLGIRLLDKLPRSTCIAVYILGIADHS